MNVVVVGAGRVGCRLAQVLEDLGDEVSIVDDQEERLDLLEKFSGLRITGVAIDIDVLKSAGIENCDAVAAVTNNDNVNLMVAQIAQDIFKVPQVLCRIYDPKRKSIFGENFSIATICPTSIAVDGVVSFLRSGVEPQIVMFGANTSTFKTIPVSDDMINKTTDIVKQDEAFKLFGVLNEKGVMEFYNNKPILLKKNYKLIICELDV